MKTTSAHPLFRNRYLKYLLPALCLALIFSIPFSLRGGRTAALGKHPQPMILGTCDTAGPIEVEATAGTLGPTAYATLKGAFDAINAGNPQSAINIQVCG